jgi:ABC-type transport system involved in cytochrome c biogenesis permease subunit
MENDKKIKYRTVTDNVSLLFYFAGIILLTIAIVVPGIIYSQYGQ